TKTGKRTYQEAREELHGSLERLRVDKVDLIQMHNLIDPDEWEQALGQGGALQTIKSLARRPWQAERTRSTWYQPLEDKDAIRNAVSWVLGDAQVFLIAAGDINLLPRILEVAGQVKSRPADSQMEKMLLNHEVQPIFRGTEFIWQR
ncbi:MAG: hypothetical protein JSV89_02455, partial [Spirochaetaceae bacterium]